MEKEVQVSDSELRQIRVSVLGFCKTQFCENLWLIKSTHYTLNFYVCIMLAFAIKDWQSNFVKSPSAPVQSCFHQRGRISRRYKRFIARNWLQQLWGLPRQVWNLYGIPRGRAGWAEALFTGRIVFILGKASSLLWKPLYGLNQCHPG